MATDAPGGDDHGDVPFPMTPMRRAIGRAMTRSKQQAPHFTVTTEVDVEDVLSALTRRDVGAGSGVRTTLTASLVHALATTLTEHPRFNAVWVDDEVVLKGAVNLSIAVAVEGGIVAPAMMGADRLSVAEIGTALADLVARARGGGLRPEEMTGGTFTLSNLGMHGVTNFTAIITPPQVAILAVGSAIPRPTVRDGQVVVRRILEMTLSSDHRVVDGVDAARFLDDLRTRIESSTA